MATLREAIIFARENPTDPRTIQLAEFIKTGQFDSIARAEGIDLSSASPTFNQQQRQPQSSLIERVGSAASNFSTGFAGAAIVNPILNVGSAVENVLENTVGRVTRPIANSLRTLLGNNPLTEEQIQADTNSSIYSRENPLNQQIRQTVEDNRQTTAGKVGQFVGEVASYAIPSTQVTRTIGTANRVRNALAQAVSSSAVATTQAGQVGTDTAIAGASELAFPLVGKLFSGVNRYVVQESLGRLSGTSQETLSEAFGAVVKNPKSRESFINAMRGNITPEEIVGTLRGNVDEIARRRSESYSNSLSKIADSEVDVSSLADNFRKQLSKYKIVVNADGSLNFSKSDLRTAPQAMTKVQEAYDEITNFSSLGKTTVSELDTTRQAVANIILKGEDRSANKANALITSAVDLVRKSGSKVKGYRQMLKKFTIDSEFLESLTKDLSANEKRTVDQTFRRMVTALRTGNEQRMKLVQELDNLTDGFVTAKIAGQQLSEPLSRGLIGTIVAGSLLGNTLDNPELILGTAPFLLFASPRVIGETINALGLAKVKSDALISAFKEGQKVLQDIVQVRPQDLLNTALTGNASD